MFGLYCFKKEFYMTLNFKAILPVLHTQNCAQTTEMCVFKKKATLEIFFTRFLCRLMHSRNWGSAWKKISAMDKKNRGFFVVYHSLKSFVFFIIFFSLRISLSVFFNCIMHRAVKQFREQNHTECSIEIITFFSLQFKCERVRERT